MQQKQFVTLSINSEKPTDTMLLAPDGTEIFLSLKITEVRLGEILLEIDQVATNKNWAVATLFSMLEESKKK